MKRIIALVLVLFWTIGSFAQSAVVKGDKGTLSKSLEANVFEFVMPNNVTAQEVNKAAAYYTDYFTVTFSEGDHVTRINFIKNDDLSRRVVNRFLLSANVRTITFQGKDYTIMEFYSNFLKKEE